MEKIYPTGGTHKEVIVAVKEGFYIYGEMVDNPKEGWITLKMGAMFGGFGGGKGMFGVARGDSESTVTLDPHDEQLLVHFPLSAVLFVTESVDLLKFKGTTLR